MALTLLLTTVLVINRLDDYFTSQQMADLDQRAETVSDYVQSRAVEAVGNGPVVLADGTVDPRVVAKLLDPDQRRIIANKLGQADVTITFGWWVTQGEGKPVFHPAKGDPLTFPLTAKPVAGQTQERTVFVDQPFPAGDAVFTPYAIDVALANPYTFRATALANVSGVLAAIALFALGLSVLVSAAMARRFTTPLRRLTEASRGLAEGDLTRRVPPNEVRAGSSELAELAVQFNAMADRLEESVEIIRRDRDRSRDFLADVSHELRTPLAALRTFNELLTEGAADDPAARTEFLESSGQQIERLDWLAQNLLELSKLDSGLVLLDLRPDDLRAAVETAVEQTHGRGKAARRRHQAASPRRADPDPPRPAAHRPGRRQPRRQRGQVHAARRLGLGRRGLDAGRGADRGGRHGRRHRGDRAAAHLRALLPRLAGERGARERERARAGDRAFDRGHARRHGRGREPRRRWVQVHRHAAARSASRRGNAGRRTSGRGLGGRRTRAARRGRRASRSPAAIGKRAGNFTVRTPQGEP